MKVIGILYPEDYPTKDLIRSLQKWSLASSEDLSKSILCSTYNKQRYRSIFPHLVDKQGVIESLSDSTVIFGNMKTDRKVDITKLIKYVNLYKGVILVYGYSTLPLDIENLITCCKIYLTKRF